MLVTQAEKFGEQVYAEGSKTSSGKEIRAAGRNTAEGLPDEGLEGWAFAWGPYGAKEAPE
jgi:hypothetical protein